MVDASVRCHLRLGLLGDALFRLTERFSIGFADDKWDIALGKCELRRFARERDPPNSFGGHRGKTFAHTQVIGDEIRCKCRPWVDVPTASVQHEPHAAMPLGEHRRPCARPIGTDLSVATPSAVEKDVDRMTREVEKERDASHVLVLQPYYADFRIRRTLDVSVIRLTEWTVDAGIHPRHPAGPITPDTATIERDSVDNRRIPSDARRPEFRMCAYRRFDCAVDSALGESGIAQPEPVEFLR